MGRPTGKPSSRARCKTAPNLKILFNNQAESSLVTVMAIRDDSHTKGRLEDGDTPICLKSDIIEIAHYLLSPFYE